MRLQRLGLVLLFAALAAGATDISRKWSGSMEQKTADGQISSTPVSAEFRQSGETVTGSAGAQGQEQFTVVNGVLRGDQLTFTVHTGDGEYAARLTVVSDSELKGEVTFGEPGGPKQTATLTLSRTK